MSPKFPQNLLNAICEKYEKARSSASKESATTIRPEGFAVIVRNGLLAWSQLIIDKFKSHIDCYMVFFVLLLFFILTWILGILFIRYFS